MDEFRLLGRYGRDPLSNNDDAALATGAVVAQGSFRRTGTTGTTRSAAYDPPITLGPGRHYLLNFTWRAAPFSGVLSLAGPSLQRLYLLPQAGESQAFGMSPGQRTAMAISTSRPAPEPVQLRLLNPTGKSARPASRVARRFQAIGDR